MRGGDFVDARLTGDKYGEAEGGGEPDERECEQCQ